MLPLSLALRLPVLQGGPGCSSLFGVFYLNGPFALQTDLTLQRNPGRWNRQYGMLFVDQPIGTGFSIPGMVTRVCSHQWKEFARPHMHMHMLTPHKQSQRCVVLHMVSVPHHLCCAVLCCVMSRESAHPQQRAGSGAGPVCLAAGVLQEA